MQRFHLDSPKRTGAASRKDAAPVLYIILLQHCAEVCAGDHTGVAAQPAGLDVGLGSDILCLALGQHLIRNFQRDAGVGDVDVDGIAFLNKANGAAGSGLRADVANGSTAGSAGEAA